MDPSVDALLTVVDGCLCRIIWIIPEAVLLSRAPCVADLRCKILYDVKL